MTTANPTFGFCQTGGSASSAYHIIKDFAVVIEGNTQYFRGSGALCGAKSERKWSWGTRRRDFPTCERCIKIRDSKEGKRSE